MTLGVLAMTALMLTGVQTEVRPCEVGWVISDSRSRCAWELPSGHYVKLWSSSDLPPVIVYGHRDRVGQYSSVGSSSVGVIRDFGDGYRLSLTEGVLRILYVNVDPPVEFLRVQYIRDEGWRVEVVAD